MSRTEIIYGYVNNLYQVESMKMESIKRFAKYADEFAAYLPIESVLKVIDGILNR